MALSYGNQLEFARDFAYYSGLDGNVVLAWCIQEQPPGSPATPGSNNWLNIQYTDQGPNSEYYHIARLPPAEAAYQSVVWMANNQPTILAAAGQSAEAQAAAIVNSGWASSKYGGLAKFTAVVHEVERASLPPTPAPPSRAKVKGAKQGAPTAGSPQAVAAQRDPKSHAPKVRYSGGQLSAHGARQVEWAGWVAAVAKRRIRHPSVRRQVNVRL